MWYVWVHQTISLFAKRYLFTAVISLTGINTRKRICRTKRQQRLATRFRLHSSKATQLTHFKQAIGTPTLESSGWSFQSMSLGGCLVVILICFVSRTSWLDQRVFHLENWLMLFSLWLTIMHYPALLLDVVLIQKLIHLRDIIMEICHC